MPRPLTLPLTACDDPSLVGGKAAGLSRLIHHGFRVPPGVCLTTEAYRRSLSEWGINPRERWREALSGPESAQHRLLTKCSAAILKSSVPEEFLRSVRETLAQLSVSESTLLAIRSSATDEDGIHASFAGLYETQLGVPLQGIGEAIKECWASVWREKVLKYHLRLGLGDMVPEMAVIIQPVLAASAAGVAFSQHPLSGHRDRVAINAVLGIAAPLVSGEVTPDQFVIQVTRGPETFRVLERTIAQKESATRLSAEGVRDEPLSTEDMTTPALTDEEAVGLARLIKDVERALHRPVDVEWAIADGATWFLQARAITQGQPHDELREDTCTWSRANFKETLPELPSPLGLSFVQEFMETTILRQYRDLGCTIPSGLSAVRIIRGRPFINVSLFQSFTVQLGGNPALITEQMGGEAGPLAGGPSRLPWWRLIRAAFRMERKIRRAARRAPAWFAEMKRMTEGLNQDSLRTATPAELLGRLDALGQRLQAGDLTLAIVAGVAQALQALEFLMKRWVGEGWRARLNASLEGLGTVISAQQILRLRDLADVARGEPSVMAYFHTKPLELQSLRLKLAGTYFLQAFDAYLLEFGHRAIGESDVMSPRFWESPGSLLEVIRSHLEGPPAKPVDDLLRQRAAACDAALRQIRVAFGWRLPLWAAFRWWYRRLCRYLALREANRHHLMYFTAATRRLTLLLGEQFATHGLLSLNNDIFFLTPDEIRACATGEVKDWRAMVAARRAERARHAEQSVSDLVVPGGLPAFVTGGSDKTGGALTGIPISTGYAEGPVRLVLTPEQAGRVGRGEILVLPVIDPGMTPLFGLAAGLIVEMGGTLSHGAIIAREHGIPAVANVRNATRLLENGERVAVDATRGQIRRCRPD
jgi:pyruvate,water dikinase